MGYGASHHGHSLIELSLYGSRGMGMTVEVIIRLSTTISKTSEGGQSLVRDRAKA